MVPADAAKYARILLDMLLLHPTRSEGFRSLAANQRARMLTDWERAMRVLLDRPESWKAVGHITRIGSDVLGSEAANGFSQFCQILRNRDPVGQAWTLSSPSGREWMTSAERVLEVAVSTPPGSEPESDGPGAASDQWLPIGYYSDRTKNALNSKRLYRAWNEGRILGKKNERGTRNLYELRSVQSAFPEHREKLWPESSP